ncbi:MAG: KpsF/GutQ family sugar-phosphate isomerase [bacterium]
MAARRSAAPREQEILNRGRRVLELEAAAIEGLAGKLGDDFCKAVALLHRCRGKVVVTGMGKSGLICQKIAATLASTGTPALFLHAVEGLHGDLGVLTRQDVVVVVSNSGETEEVNRLLPPIKRLGVPLIALTSSPGSTLAKHADIVIDTGVREEACPMNLVPTASTTAALALGDALAIALIGERGFQKEDFALLHPGGALGRKLLYRVDDLMHSGEDVPIVGEHTPLKDAVFEISSKRLGMTGVRDERGHLVGVITDGDLRRGLEKKPDLLQRRAGELMTLHPKRIRQGELAAKALQVMEQFSITSLFVVSPEDEQMVVGIIHIHDLLKAGIA